MTDEEFKPFKSFKAFKQFKRHVPGEECLTVIPNECEESF
jgi:hypothetical protein